jgi:hypothetical protein
MDQALSREMTIARAAAAALREAGIADDDPDFAVMLESESDALEMLRGILRSARLDEAFSDAAKKLARETQDRASRLADRAQSKRDAVLQALCELDVKRLDAPDMTVTVSAGRPGVEITDLSLVPERYVRVKVEADRAAINAAMKDGEAIPGVVAKNPRPTLTIRSR